MRLVIFTAPAPGVVNHCMALAGLLRGGGHATWVVTSPDMRAHVEALGAGVPVRYAASHHVDFNRVRPGRRPHLAQICDPPALEACLRDQLAIAGELAADALVTRHFFSVQVAAALLGLPYVAYLTDGPLNLLPGRHPMAGVATAEMTGAVAALHERHGVEPPRQAVPYCLESAHLNLVRGLPETSGLRSAELGSLPATAEFCGLLTFDGDRTGPEDLPPAGGRPRVYVTYGTICYEVERYRATVQALAGLDVDAVLTSMHVAADAIGPLPPNVSVRRYVPNDRALEWADAVVHHGGHGTFLGALAAGVPQVVAPDNVVTTNQAQHCAMARSMGVGECLEGELTAAALRAAIGRALEPGRLAAAAAARARLAERDRDARRRALARVGELERLATVRGGGG